MKKKFFLSIIIMTGLFLNSVLWAQSIPHNSAPASLEHNVLFNAVQRYQVSQTGPATFNLSKLFDGIFYPVYPAVGPTADSPHTILIEGLPNYHTQRGAWIGWSTRYWHARKFQIWGYEIRYKNDWIKLADETNNTQHYFIKKLPSGRYTKFKFIFYEATGTEGRIGLSEIYYIHPEATRPYAGLIPYSLEDLSDNGIHASNGNVGIGTAAPQSKLAVNGTITAKEVKVTNTGWPDFVFEKDYDLPSLDKIARFIKENKHLPDIPSAKKVEQKGLPISKILAKQMQKIEELTLYIIEQDRKIKNLEEQMATLSRCNHSN